MQRYTPTVDSGVSQLTGDSTVSKITEFYQLARLNVMKLEVVSHWVKGKEHFEFTLFDGPDGLERAHGYSTDLIVAFTKVIEWREKISRDYESLPEPSARYDTGVGQPPQET